MINLVKTDYEDMASVFDKHAGDSAYNAHYDRPAVLDLAGEIAGQRVLDAGCGPGHHAAELIARGAEVVAVDGALSTRHPTTDLLRKGGSYFDVREEEDAWHRDERSFRVRFWREPLSLCGAVSNAGFLIERIVEPLPSPSMRDRWPEDWEKLQREPGFLVLRLLEPVEESLRRSSQA